MPHSKSRTTIRFLMVTAAVFLLASCGGGSGGDGGGSSPPSNPPATLKLSTTTLVAEGTVGQAPPTSGFTAGITTTAASTKFYLKGSYTTHGISSVASVDTSGDISIQFKSPSSIGAGIYQDTVTIEGCYDQACTQQVQGSPQTISVTYTVLPAAPTITSLSPATVQADAPVTLTVNGSGFIATSVVVIDGAAVPTTFISSTELTASISASVIAEPDNYFVMVAPSLATVNGNPSNQLMLLALAQPAITGLTPNSVVAGSPGFTLTVAGSNFPQGAVVLFGGTALPTTWVGDYSHLTATVTQAQVFNAGTVPVTVATSSATDAVVSAPASFVVQPLPALTANSIHPSIVTAGGPAFVLTVLGQGFSPSSIVNRNGTALQTTYNSELQLQAQVPASDITSTGNATITVQNAPSPGATAPLTLKIAASAPDAVSVQITPDHAGAVNFNTLSFPTTNKWSANVGGAPSYALIVDGKVIVTVAVNDTTTELIALDQATGSTVWGPIQITGFGTTTYDGGKVFVVGSTFGGETVQSFDVESGALDWTTSLLPGFSAGLTASNGIIYTSDNNYAVALSEASGSVLWTMPIFGGGTGTPAVSGNNVYLSYSCSTYDFQASTGAQVFWTNTGCEDGSGTITVVANGLVYSPTGSSDSQGEIVNATSGAALGPYQATGSPAFSPTAGYFLQNGSLNALSGSNNTVLWSFTGDSALIASPIVVNQTVIIESSNGNVYAVSQATGQQLWTINAGAPFQPSSNTTAGLAAGDGLLIVPVGNQVVAYTLSTNP